jgi:hypothetical protein
MAGPRPDARLARSIDVATRLRSGIACGAMPPEGAA